MRTLLTLIFIMLVSAAIAQSETFDLTSYTPPQKQSGWKKDVKETIVSYSKSDKTKKNWCQIGIYKSTTSKGSIDADFESEWQMLAATPYKITDTPKTDEIQKVKGWEIKVGSGTFFFNKNDAQVILSVMSGYNKAVSILAITNSQDYLPQIQDLLLSVDLTIPETNSEKAPLSNADNTAVVGSWGKSNTVGQINNRFGTYSYNKQQYIFNQNGTYIFIAKNYSEQYDETLLIKENGTYSINENNISINPTKSVTEAWSKSNGADNYKKLKTRQNRSLEKTTYQFILEEKNLVLRTDKETERDGRFSNGNAYSYGPPGTFTPIKLPGQ